MKQILVLTSFLFLNSLAFAQQNVNIFNVQQHGVKGDSATVNTTAIQALIDYVSKKGGGTVYFPSGQYISGTILIKDNVTLFLDEKASLIGSDSISEYKLVDPFRTGNGAPMGYCFIGAVDAKNVGITGKGRINGRGKELLAVAGRSKRPFLIRFVRTTGITLKDISLTNSAAWTCHFFASRNITIAGVSIFCRGLGNNDGFDIDCSQNVNISDCDIDTGDDALCFKTTWSKMACRDIVVKNLRITSNHGGIKWGTESMAPFENIKISDIYIYDTRNGGIKMNAVDGAQIRNVEISNVVMNNVRTPMMFRLGSRLNVFRPEEDTQQAIGNLENVRVRNVKAKAAAEAQLKPPTGILISGVPGHYIKNLTLENIEISLPGGGEAKHARHPVPEAEKQYPEVSTFGPTIPAYGIWARHVIGLTLNKVSFTLDSADLRPAFVVQDGSAVTISNCTVPASEGAESIVRLEEVTGAMVKNNSVAESSAVLVKVEGKNSKNVKVSANKLSKKMKLIEWSTEGTSKASKTSTTK